MYEVILTREAEDQLTSIDIRYQKAIISALKRLDGGLVDLSKIYSPL